MKESFLHYIWQFQYFTKEALTTCEGHALTVFKTGLLNTHAGPDFQSAKIKIGILEWSGNIEVHVKASEWNDHKHFRDQAYDSVILHVVWVNDKPVFRSDGTPLPTLALKGRVDEWLLHSYEKLMESAQPIPCANVIPSGDRLLIASMLDAALAQRLEAKATLVTEIVKRNNHDWEQTTFELLAKNFGFKVNSEPFQQLARSLSYKTVLKHADSLLQIEALLFGQGGFLESEVGDEYYQLLRREYRILKLKYSLTCDVKESQWRFLRLRPANFPTLRIAQFASVLFTVKNIFSVFAETEGSKAIKSLFSVHQSTYWKQHYQFNKQAKNPISGLGLLSMDNLIINTIAPILAAYGKAQNDQDKIDKAIYLLQQLKPESNAIIRKWNILGIIPTNASDSQALIELYNNYCIPRKCIDCRIGSAILKPAKHKSGIDI
jgi:hypothetical protein